MASEVEVFFNRWKDDRAKTKEQAPDIVRAVDAMFQAMMKEGALTVREKELIALGVGLAEQCVPCINLHVQKCLKAGATREQILEAAGVVVMMRGGPSFTYIPEIIHALDYLEQRR